MATLSLAAPAQTLLGRFAAMHGFSGFVFYTVHNKYKRAWHPYFGTHSCKQLMSTRMIFSPICLHNSSVGYRHFHKETSNIWHSASPPQPTLFTLIHRCFSGLWARRFKNVKRSYKHGSRCIQKLTVENFKLGNLDSYIHLHVQQEYLSVNWTALLVHERKTQVMH